MALLLGPVLYGHILHRVDLAESRDFGSKAAESFWRAYGIGDAGLPSQLRTRGAI